jgi:hypothetical protein
MENFAKDNKEIYSEFNWKSIFFETLKRIWVKKRFHFWDILHNKNDYYGKMRWGNNFKICDTSFWSRPALICIQIFEMDMSKNRWWSPFKSIKGLCSDTTVMILLLILLWKYLKILWYLFSNSIKEQGLLKLSQIS